MKFYEFPEDRYEYYAVIWAENIQEAKKTYELEINREMARGNPRVIDSDEVAAIMSKAGIDRDSDTAIKYGVSGDFWEIINTKISLVIFARE